MSSKKLNSEVRRRLSEATRDAVRMVSDFFGEMPYDGYVFQHVFAMAPGVGQQFGALEHGNSSTYILPYFDYAVNGFDLVQVITHEYWHLWSPKRIHVDQLGPFDYQQAPRTSSLWFAEGVTEYYSHLLCARNLEGSRKFFLRRLAQEMRAHYGRKEGSIADMSRNISRIPFGEIHPLYGRGLLLGLSMDLEIRRQSNNRTSLDDAMRYMNNEYGRKGKSFADDQIIPIIERATGTSLSSFEEHYINGQDSLPVDKYLADIGIQFTYWLADGARALSGLQVSQREQGWTVDTVAERGIADQVGLRAGDVLQALYFPETAVSPSNAYGSARQKEIQLETMSPSEMTQILKVMPEHLLSLKITRNQQTIVIPATAMKHTIVEGYLTIDPNASESAQALRTSMFGF